MTTERYWRLKEAGLCACCGEKEPVSGRVYCQSCLDWERLQSRSRRRVYAEIGICTTCGKAAPEKGRKTCRTCINKRIARYGEKRRSAAAAEKAVG